MSPILVPLQLLHSVTFAMGYMGCVHFIANWTSEDIAAEAQSFFQVLQQAMAVMAVDGVRLDRRAVRRACLFRLGRLCRDRRGAYLHLHAADGAEDAGSSSPCLIRSIC